jgi:hypothetical protein
MKLKYRLITGILGAITTAFVCLPHSLAQCGGMRQPALVHSSLVLRAGQPRLLQASEDSTAPGIIGFWHVKFITKDSPGIPDGTEVDAGYAQWHSDGTEIMNSGGRSPLTGDFCLGVWKQVGENTYKLNHFAAAWDSTGSELIGPANIREEVVLTPDRKHFDGTFTIDQYDEAGAKLAHVQGVIKGSRIEYDSGVDSIF